MSLEVASGVAVKYMLAETKAQGLQDIAFANDMTE